MEKHTCKLCYRSFANGRALGGHMRSHVTSGANKIQAVVKDSSSSSPSPSYSSTSSRGEENENGNENENEHEEEGEGKGMSGLGYGLRSNPRKSFRLVDPEFSSTFAAVDAGSSVVVQDRESETESSRAPTHRRRSKRARRSSQGEPEPEPVSSVSDTTPEEDVALSLMMLSRDFWTPKKTKSEFDEEEEEEEEGQEQEREEKQEQQEEEEPIAARSMRGRMRWCKNEKRR